MATVSRIQVKHPSEMQALRVISEKGSFNYLLVGVLFLLPAVLLSFGVILFLNSSPSPVIKKMEQSVSEPIVEQIVQKPELMNQAGNFFEHVFDKGVFSDPLAARADYQFLMDQESKAVFLRIDYDVSPGNSASGVYLKTRDLDLSKFKRMSFSAKSDEEKLFPDRFRIEFKDQFSVVRRFSVAPATYGWNFYEFDFNVDKPMNISEVVFVFENRTVGSLATTGAIYFKDLTIE